MAIKFTQTTPLTDRQKAAFKDIASRADSAGAQLKEATMKNSELLAYTGELPNVDRQRQFVLQLQTQQQPCPSCGTPQSPLQAHGIALDDYDVSTHLPDLTKCVACDREIKYSVPLIYAGRSWVWTLIPIPPPPKTRAWTRAEIGVIGRIAERAVALAVANGKDISRPGLVADLVATHDSVGLRLDELLAADDFNFAHDVFGIYAHANRRTGQLDDCFVPRFAIPKPPISD